MSKPVQGDPHIDIDMLADIKKIKDSIDNFRTLRNLDYRTLKDILFYMRICCAHIEVTLHNRELQRRRQGKGK